MKNIIILALLGFSAWNYYIQNIISKPSSTPDYSEPIELNRAARIQNLQNSFTCDGRVYCSQMTSRAEAEFFTRNCPNTKMDGDDDGIPCENDTRF